MNKVNLVMLFIIFNLWMLSSEAVGLLEFAEKGDVSAIRLRLEEEKEKLILLTNDVEVLMLKVARLERQLLQSSEHVPLGLHQNISVTPAFMAFMFKSFVCLENQHAVFDDVRLNVGNYYNRHHCVFQAPVSGTYHFALTLSNDNQSGHDFYAYIVAGTTKEIWQARTVSVLAYLESGEDVWIRCIHDSEIAVTGSGGLTGANQCRCPSNYTFHTPLNLCFRLSKERQTYETAKQICESEGGHLAKVNTTEIQLYLKEQIKNSRYIPKGSNVFIGGNDIEKEGIWRWSDRELIDLNSPIWYPGEPQGKEIENCILLYGDADYCVVDAGCSRHEYYVCQIE